MAATATIIPRDMIIMQSNDDTIWRWFPDEGVEMCVLLESPSVLVCGALVKPKLQELTAYDVKFVVSQAKDQGNPEPNYMFRFEVPGDTGVKHTALHEGDNEVLVGSFTTTDEDDLEYLRVYLYQLDKDITKKGLIIKGVNITPSDIPNSYCD